MRNLLFILLMSISTLSFAQDNISDWKSYSKKGYSIQYPATYEMQLTHPAEMDFVIYLPKPEGSEFQENISLITQSLKGQDVNIQTYTDINIEQLKSTFPSFTIVEQSQYEANGMFFMQLNYTIEYSGTTMQCLQAFSIVKNTAYILTYTTVPELYAQNAATVSTLFKTFTVKKK